jgi:type IV pilus assembly protein PilB
VPYELAQRYGVLPLARTQDTLRVAVGDPLNDGLEVLAHQVQPAIDPVLALPGEIERAIARFYGRDRREVSAVLDELKGAQPEGRAKRTGAPDPDRGVGVDDAPLIQLVERLIAEAMPRRASDIHLEPLGNRLRIRYRIDGALQEGESPPRRLQAAIISRVKLMAGMSIDEKRAPQDGRIRVTVGGEPLDLRASCLPTVHGESIVLRILDQRQLRLGLAELGLAADDRQVFERLLALPDGIVLVTGPTGSGKTTTLYSCLHHLNQPGRKIITVEDPIEYQLAGINQVPVRKEVGLTFAVALRAMLRQAPNVIMVGEIRDRETAEIAINAALTGHMVFSTLHTNDAPGAVTRLLDIGVKPFLVAAALRAVVAQRLVRTVCRSCGRPVEFTAAERAAVAAAGLPTGHATLRRGAGCPECGGTGYRGRIGIFEIFLVNDAIQQLIYDNVTASKLRATARLNGMRTMRQDGLRKGLTGLTTIDEIAAATVDDPS